MEFTAGGRLRVRVTPADVGKRVSVRQLTGSGAGTEKFTDTVGVLTSWDNGVLLITRRTGESVRVPEAALVAGKVVPAAPARRRGPAADFEELARAGARAWQPVESEPLGGWLLRASSGFTRRANSALPLGDPGIPLDEALARVREWYGERGLPAYIQAATGAEGTQERLCAELEGHGWRPEVAAEVRIAALAPVAVQDADVSGVRLERTASAGWIRRYQRFGVAGPDVPGPHGSDTHVPEPHVPEAHGPEPDVAEAHVAEAHGPEPRVAGPHVPGHHVAGPHVLHVLGSGPSVWFASVAGAGEVPAAIGRCVVDGRWAGFMAVEVGPEHRRQGLATAVMTALARRALEEGASAAWLQVETDNEAARALYEGMGFAVHHRYHHFRAP
ncbi:GNAT family N-acetyltransferase [Streptomyces sp. GMY02]|uniref:GNAT family N-acetyltransferase n=1 Tax=Streptomyces sp. GMY02 TaxID=1333528 RepID=UPI0020B646E7|nr:GNAT family N-acetyltransferase [Streptomyces sp. GMY02]